FRYKRSVIPESAREENVQRLNEFSTRKMQCRKVTAGRFIEGPSWTFSIIDIAMLFVIGFISRYRVRTRLMDRLPRLRHALGGLIELSFAPLQFRPQPARCRSIATCQPEPACRVLVVAVVICRPA